MSEEPWILGTHPGNESLHIIRPIMLESRVVVLPKHEGGAVAIRDEGVARLIAASPDLLEACKALYAALQDTIRRPMGVVPDSAIEAMKLHDAAIAKATTPP